MLGLKWYIRTEYFINRIKSLLLLIFSMLVLTGCKNTSETEVWHSAYLDYVQHTDLSDFTYTDAEYSYINIDEDNIPELYIRWESYDEHLEATSHYQMILSCKENGVVRHSLLQTWTEGQSSRQEYTGFIEGGNLFESEEHASTVMSDGYSHDYYSIDTNGIDAVKEFYNCANDEYMSESDYGDAASENRKYFIDNTEVSIQEYRSEIYLLREKGEWKKFDELQMMSWDEFANKVSYSVSSATAESASTVTAESTEEAFSDSTDYPNYLKCEYDWNKFRFKGQKMVYDDPLYETYFGIDVSYIKGDVDWDKVKEQGVDFAIIHLGDMDYNSDKYVTDEYFEKNIKGAEEAGM